MLESYRGKKIFITGHTGFKGSWLLAVLSNLNAQVKGYALVPEFENSCYSDICGETLCESVIADIRDKRRLEDEIIKFQPDFVFHLAAQALVRRSYLIPSETFEVNVIGTSYLLEIVNKLQKKCVVVVITTDKVYKNTELGNVFKEEDRLGGHDPYSASKACAEIVAESFNKSFVLNNSNSTIKIATARAGNVIGGGDYSEDRLIPDFIRSILNNKPLIIRSPHSVRPWQHVLEPIIGYLILGLSLYNRNINQHVSYNFGPEPEDQITVKEVLDKLITFWGSGNYNVIKSEVFHEAKLLRLGIDKAKRELNWEPKWSAKMAIQKTVEWYKSSDKREITRKQVLEYLKG